MKFDEPIAEESIWITNTPTQLEKKLPFYIMEAGHFYAYANYMVHRDHHDSFLFLYTLHGTGIVSTQNMQTTLSAGKGIILNCHQEHSYFADHCSWEFIWLHINGTSVQTFYELLYPLDIFAIDFPNAEQPLTSFQALLALLHNTGIENALNISNNIHALYNSCISYALRKEQTQQKRSYEEDLKIVLAYLQSHLQEQISIDDMIQLISISKYHFIRLFKRSYGVTPYHYLNMLRINAAKTMLRTTDSSIADIAWQCGFQDTSNFIFQFKKYTDQKPTAYRKAFSPDR